MSTVHIASANARDLVPDDTVTQGGIPFRVLAVTGTNTVGFGFEPDAVWLQPVANGDGIPMGDDCDVYLSRVNYGTWDLRQARWYAPLRMAMAAIGQATTRKATP